MTEKEAQNACACLKEIREDVSCIDRNTDSFRRGITVAPYYMAKGLEFDQVFIIGGDEKHPMFRNFRYISATRALHELYVYDIS